MWRNYLLYALCTIFLVDIAYALDPPVVNWLDQGISSGSSQKILVTRPSSGNIDTWNINCFNRTSNTAFSKIVLLYSYYPMYPLVPTDYDLLVSDNSVIEVSVLRDCDVASLYGVETKEVNRAVKNNPDKFPKGYIITVKKEEKAELVKNFHQFNTLKHSYVPIKEFAEVVANCDHLQNLKFRSALLYGFTGHGTMLAAVLNAGL